MSDARLPESLFHGRAETASRRLLWTGVAMLVLGVAAIVFPIASTLVATLMVGWMLLLFGVIALMGSFSIHGTGPFFGALLVALLSTAAGVSFLLNPIGGAAGLTLIVAFLFCLQGASEISFALEIRPFDGWVGLLVSGIVSVAAAILILAGWPAISLVLLGVLFGLNFVSTGIAEILLSRALKSLP
jgi:uncharacterized membrane protein HdeD (DUF308 family)